MADKITLRYLCDEANLGKYVMETLMIDRLLDASDYPVDDDETGDAKTALGIPDSLKVTIRSVRGYVVGNPDLCVVGPLPGFNPYPLEFGDGERRVHPMTRYRYDGLERLGSEPRVRFSVLGPALYMRPKSSIPYLTKVLEGLATVRERGQSVAFKNAVAPFVRRMFDCGTPVLVADIVDGSYVTMYKFDYEILGEIHDDFVAFVAGGAEGVSELVECLPENDSDEEGVGHFRENTYSDGELLASRLITQAFPLAVRSTITFRFSTLFFIPYYMAAHFLKFDDVNG